MWGEGTPHPLLRLPLSLPLSLLKCGWRWQVTGKSIKVKQQQEARPGDYPEMWAIPQKIMDETGWRAK